MISIFSVCRTDLISAHRILLWKFLIYAIRNFMCADLMCFILFSSNRSRTVGLVHLCVCVNMSVTALPHETSK